MTAVALIPARGQSKRVRDKNLRVVGGHPLVAWSIRAAVESETIGAVYVSTDSADIASVSESYGATIITRPPSLATDTASLESVVTHALGDFPPDWDVCALLQPTSPLRWTQEIDCAVLMLRAGERYDSVVGVVEDPTCYFQWGKLGRLYSGRPRTQDISRYRETGALYAFTRECWRHCHNRVGSRPGLLEMTPQAGWDINNEWEMEVADNELWRHQLRRKSRIAWPLRPAEEIEA